MNNKALVREQFGKTAATYLTSKPHAQGKSLSRLLELVAPKKDWRALDVATGGGHVAYTFAPHVAKMWATDITDEMLAMVSGEAQKRGLANLRTAYAKAESLPFDEGSFNLVTVRIAPHHFESIPAFLGEAARVLIAGGVLAIVDNVVPAGSVGNYVNAFERLRDPSHLRAWTLQEWRDAIAAAGFVVTHEEQIYKTMDFNFWAGRHDATMQALLQAMLVQVTPDVAAVLTPKADGDALSFRLQEGLFIAKKK